MDNNLINCVVDPNKMYVTISLKKPSGEENLELSSQLMLAFLTEELGVRYGINYAALEALSYCIEYNKPMVVAEGKPVQNGVDGHFDFYVEMEDKKAKPVVAPDGSVDYVNSLSIAMVEEGQVFARYIEPTIGECGINIYGESIQPIPGKPANTLRGKGFSISEDDKEYTATRSGRIFMDDKRVVIEPLYSVNGDLDVSHGNIVFNGDVEIRGDVRSGTKIEADGSIFIGGHVGSCEIRAGGNITIGKGIQGKYNSRIHANGDIAGNYCEHCKMTAGGKIYANSLLDCDVSAYDSVIVTSKTGCIIGGSVRAMQLVEAKDIGNDAEIPTKVYIGVFEEAVREVKTCQDKRYKCIMDINTLSKKQRTIDAIPREQRSPETLELYKQIMQAKVIKGKEKMELERKIEHLNEMIDKASKNASAIVNGAVYPGVKVSSGNNTFTVDMAVKEAAFRPGLGRVEMMSIDELKTILINTNKKEE